MADENAYLQYEDGLVLHNGLPVKWVTAASAYESWKDFDIIIERYDCDIPNYNYNYVGFSVPLRGGRNNQVYSFSPYYWNNDADVTYRNASARWGTAIREHNGDIQMKTSPGKACDIICKTGTWAQITGTDPKIPSEELSNSAIGYLYPTSAGNHYFFGVKFGNNYGTPNVPDLTNHGKPTSAGGWAIIHKLYAPNCSSFDYSMNASNYSAIKNVYAPLASAKDEYSAGVYVDTVGSPRRGNSDDQYAYQNGTPRLFENWFVPKLPYYANAEVHYQGTSSINITAAKYLDQYSFVKNISAGSTMKLTACTADGFLTAPDMSISEMTLSATAACTNFTGTSSTIDRLAVTNDVKLTGCTVNTSLQCNNVTADKTKLSDVTANKLSGWNCSGGNLKASTIAYSGFADSISGRDITLNASANIPVSIAKDGHLSVSGISAQSFTASGFFTHHCRNLNMSASGGISIYNDCYNMTAKADKGIRIHANYTSANGNDVSGINATGAYLNIDQYSAGNYAPWALPALGNFTVYTSADLGRGTQLNLTAGPDIQTISARQNVRINRLYSENLGHILDCSVWKTSGGIYGAGWNNGLTAYGTLSLGPTTNILLPMSFSGNVDLRNITVEGQANETIIGYKTTTQGWQTVYLPKAYSAKFGTIRTYSGPSQYGHYEFV